MMKSCLIVTMVKRVSGIFCMSICISICLIPHSVNGKKCPGKCIYNVTDCKSNGGKIAGYCTNDLACCDYSFKKIGSCGAKMSKLATAIFQSPDYPDTSSGDIVCQFDFELSSNATGVSVDYTDVLMDGRGFIKHSACESDVFYLKGFPNWTPPAQCGNLTNYVAVIDLGNRLTKNMKTLTVLALMSSNKYRWNVKVTQHFNETKKKSFTYTTTESPSKRIDDDDDSSERESPYDPSKRKRLYEEESEQDEIQRITQLIANSNVPRVSLDVSMGFDDETQDYIEEPMIVNGEDTEISTVPWQASLRSIVTPRLAKLLPQLKLKNCTIDEGIHFCGGSIISDRHILSATHCFLIGEKLQTWQKTSSMKIVLGDSNLCDESKDGVQEFKVEKVYFHYAYDTEAILNDVVVIKLDRKIRFSDKIQTIKMATHGAKLDHQIAFASGWGLTNLTAEEKARTPEQLQSAREMFVGNSSYCKDQQMRLYPKIKSESLVKYPKYVDVFSSLLCTYVRNGSLARVVGQGDSGGPLILMNGLVSNSSNDRSSSSEEKTDPILIGVISYMIPIPHEVKEHDVSKYVDFYQSVPYYRKWIDLAMQ